MNAKRVLAGFLAAAMTIGMIQPVMAEEEFVQPEISAEEQVVAEEQAMAEDVMVEETDADNMAAGEFDLIDLGPVGENAELSGDTEEFEEEELQLEQAYALYLQKCENGEIRFAEAEDLPEAEPVTEDWYTECRSFSGEEMLWFSVLPNPGYRILTVEAKSLTEQEKAYKLSEIEGQYLLVMPEDSVVVAAEFVPDEVIPAETPDEVPGAESVDGAVITDTADEAVTAESADTAEDTETPEKTKTVKSKGKSKEKEEAEDAESEETLQTASSKTYKISDTIKGTLQNGVLTVSGKGEIPNYSREDTPPWTADAEFIKSIVIKSGITSVGTYCFYMLYNAETVTIPESVTFLGDDSFFYCQSLKKVKLPSKIKHLGPCFRCCYSLEELIINEGCESLEGHILYGCSSMQNLKIPASVKSINEYAFWNSAVATVTVDPANKVYQSRDNLLLTKDGKTLILCPPRRTDSTFSAKGIETIGGYAFSNMTSLKNVDLTGVKKIEGGAFHGSGLEEVVLPASIKECEQDGFNNCKNLKKVTINGIAEIPNGMFANCISLKTVNFGSSVRRINSGAFVGCTSLENVTLPETIEFVSTDAFPATTKITMKNKKLVSYGSGGYIKANTVTLTGLRDYQKAYEVLDLVNAERAKKGRKKLYMDQSLLESAMVRAGECSVCFSHERPDSTDIRTVNAKLAGENIATGRSTADGVMNIWMNSKWHRKNILCEGYSSIGIGCFEINGTCYWVQCFGKNTLKANSKKPGNINVTQKVTLPCEEFPSVVGASVETYSYSYQVTANDLYIKKGDSTAVSIYVKNCTPDFEKYIPIDSGSVNWSSSNTKVAAVSTKGKVTGVGNGTATITAISKQGNKLGSVTITVNSTGQSGTGSAGSTGSSTVSNRGVFYSTHVQTYGWQDYVKNGQMSGTQGKSKRLEAISILLSDMPCNGGIEYRTHVQTYGWQGWKADGAVAGTSGEGKRLEAIQIRLTGDVAKMYDVYYQTHIQTFGWSGWAKNSEMCGSAGYSKRLEGIRIMLVEKGGQAPSSSASCYYNAARGSSGNSGDPTSKSSGALIGYNTHVQTYGWQNYAYDGGMAGTSGQSKRLEGIHISLIDKPYGGDIVYRTHVQTIGWQSWMKNGQMSGTSGQSKRLEGIQIKLTGEMAKHYDVYYRVHAQSYGWLDWAKNGQMAGTSGLSKRLEAINIKLVPKGGKAPGKTAKPNVVGK